MQRCFSAADDSLSLMKIMSNCSAYTCSKPVQALVQQQQMEQTSEWLWCSPRPPPGCGDVQAHHLQQGLFLQLLGAQRGACYQAPV